MNSFRDVIKKAREPENQVDGKPDYQQPVVPPAKEEEVNLSIKVPKRLRRHWAAEAKKHDTTLTAVITRALTERFGEP